MKNYGLNPTTKETYPLEDWETPVFGQKVAEFNENGVCVSTVFLCMDHSYNEGIGAPILFETMIFGGMFDTHMWRYSTWDEAAEGHRKAVKAVRASFVLE